MSCMALHVIVSLRGTTCQKFGSDFVNHRSVVGVDFCFFLILSLDCGSLEVWIFWLNLELWSLHFFYLEVGNFNLKTKSLESEV